MTDEKNDPVLEGIKEIKTDIKEVLKVKTAVAVLKTNQENQAKDINRTEKKIDGHILDHGKWRLGMAIVLCGGLIGLIIFILERLP